MLEVFSTTLISLVMSISPGSRLGDRPLDFRAPPPSPIATGHRPSFANESVLADFLSNALKVPELVLPDNIVPVRKLDEAPPTIDLKSFYSSESDIHLSEAFKSVGRIGCFELINHGISDDLIKEVMDEAGNIFDLSMSEKDSIRKSTEKIYGFEERSGVEQDGILGEEFVWGIDEDLMSKLEAVLPSRRYSNFSTKMEVLSSIIERVASKILQQLKQHNDWTASIDNAQAVVSLGSVCCFHKHGNMEEMTLDEWTRTQRYDAIRMLLRRGYGYCHALGIHICNGCSEFHSYSKKGWVSFVPQNRALVITLGDQIQAWSGGVQKQVMGKPIFKGDIINFKDNVRANISMAFLYSPSPHLTKKLRLGHEDEDEDEDEDDTNIITLGQQLYFAILLTLAYQFLNFIFSLF